MAMLGGECSGCCAKQCAFITPPDSFTVRLSGGTSDYYATSCSAPIGSGSSAYYICRSRFIFGGVGGTYTLARIAGTPDQSARYVYAGNAVMIEVDLCQPFLFIPRGGTGPAGGKSVLRVIVHAPVELREINTYSASPQPRSQAFMSSESWADAALENVPAGDFAIQMPFDVRVSGSSVAAPYMAVEQMTADGHATYSLMSSSSLIFNNSQLVEVRGSKCGFDLSGGGFTLWNDCYSVFSTEDLPVSVKVLIQEPVLPAFSLMFSIDEVTANYAGNVVSFPI